MTTTTMNKMKCPYCSTEKIIENEARYCAENIAHKITCDHCKKNFVFYTETVFDFHPRKADCLNESQHQLTNWVTLWVISNSKKVQSRRCKDCEYREQRTMIYNEEEDKHNE